MDLGVVLGLLGGCVVVVGSILVAGASLKAFWDLPSVVCVIGGAITAVFSAFPLSVVLTVPRVFLKALFPRTLEAKPVIAQLVEFAEVARRDGILALEGRIADVQDSFMKLGLQMAIDGTDAGVMEGILRTEMDCVATRHKTGKALLDCLNKYAPAWGMIGTLVGLVIMLGNMSDPNAIGPGMAVALLTTLYGAVVANMVCAPLGDKLAGFSRKEMEAKEIIVRGILGIQVGDNPRVLEQKLQIFLEPKDRKPDEAK